jgi:N-acyl-D-amino-acid deacylase
MTLMPAQRLEARVPDMALRGRIAPGSYADIVVFDPATVHDTATYEQPARYAIGMRHVLVNGQSVVYDGEVVTDALPGQPVRAPLR